MKKIDKNYPLAIVLDEEYLFDAYVGNSVLFAKKTKLQTNCCWYFYGKTQKKRHLF